MKTTEINQEPEYILTLELEEFINQWIKDNPSCYLDAVKECAKDGYSVGAHHNKYTNEIQDYCTNQCFTPYEQLNYDCWFSDETLESTTEEERDQLDPEYFRYYSVLPEISEDLIEYIFVDVDCDFSQAVLSGYIGKAYEDKLDQEEAVRIEALNKVKKAYVEQQATKCLNDLDYKMDNGQELGKFIKEWFNYYPEKNKVVYYTDIESLYHYLSERTDLPDIDSIVDIKIKRKAEQNVDAECLNEYNFDILIEIDPEFEQDRMFWVNQSSYYNGKRYTSNVIDLYVNNCEAEPNNFYSTIVEMLKQQEAA